MPKQVPNLPPVVTVNPLHGLVSPEKTVSKNNPLTGIELKKALVSYGMNRSPRIKYGHKENANTAKVEKLFEAIQKQSQEEVTESIQSGANINTKDFTITPLLHAVLVNRNPEFIEFLLKSGADVNQPGMDFNISPLHAVCSDTLVDDSTFETIKILLRYGADINAQRIDVEANGERGETPLMSACFGMHKEIVKLLLQNGADVNIIDERDDVTALYLTVKYMFRNLYKFHEYKEIVKLLMEAGADIHIGKNPLEIEGVHTNPEVVELLGGGGAAGGAQRRRRRKGTRKYRKATRKTRKSRRR